MKLTTQIEFSDIFSNFYNETHTLEDIAQIINLVRLHNKELTIKEIQTLLEIPLVVLQKQTVIPDVTAWAKENARYFAGNHQIGPIHVKFEQGNFDLHTIVEALEEIINSETSMRSDFYLRNIEVVLKHDVHLCEYSTFKQSGHIFYEQMKKAF